MLSHSLQWHHNEPDWVSNHQPHDCLLNRLLKCRWKKTSRLIVMISMVNVYNRQDRRWNADKPSAALDPYIPTWLTTSSANRRPANFWKPFFFFENIGRKLWKVVQSQVELMWINFKFEALIHSLILEEQINNHLYYLSVYYGKVDIFSQYVYMIFSVAYLYPLLRGLISLSIYTYIYTYIAIYRVLA